MFKYTEKFTELSCFLTFQKKLRTETFFRPRKAGHRPKEFYIIWGPTIFY